MANQSPVGGFSQTGGGKFSLDELTAQERKNFLEDQRKEAGKTEYAGGGGTGGDPTNYGKYAAAAALANSGMLGPLLAMFGPGGSGASGAAARNEGMRDAFMRSSGGTIGLPKPQSGPGGPSRGSGRNIAPIAGPSPEYQKKQAHQEQSYQQNQAYGERSRNAALDFGYEQKRGSMKSKLAQQLLQSILGGKMGRGLNDPRVTTEDSQGIGERGGVSVPVSLHSSQSVRPGGQDRAQMMAQILQAIQGMV